MDMFRDYFSREELMGSIAKAQYLPGRFAELFESRALTSTTLALEDLPKNGASVLSAVPRGTPSKIETLERRNVFTFTTNHYRADGSVYADELLNMRAVGANAAVEVIQMRRDELIARLRRDIDFTHESLRTATIVTPTNHFGNMPAEATIAFVADATKTRAEIFTKIIKPMEVALDGIPFSGIRVFCDDALWAKVIENKAIKDTWMGYAMAANLRNDPREQVSFAGVTFERHRGSGTVIIPSGKARAIPEGVPGMWIQAFAPADTHDTVGMGRVGTPYYPQSIPSSDNRRWYFEIQTNCVMVCTRPTCVLPLASSD